MLNWFGLATKKGAKAYSDKKNASDICPILPYGYPPAPAGWGYQWWVTSKGLNHTLNQRAHLRRKLRF